MVADESNDHNKEVNNTSSRGCNEPILGNALNHRAGSMIRLDLGRRLMDTMLATNAGCTLGVHPALHVKQGQLLRGVIDRWLWRYGGGLVAIPWHLLHDVRCRPLDSPARYGCRHYPLQHTEQHLYHQTTEVKPKPAPACLTATVVDTPDGASQLMLLNRFRA
jgi:hypothetical protein